MNTPNSMSGCCFGQGQIHPRGKGRCWAPFDHHSYLIPLYVCMHPVTDCVSTHSLFAWTPRSQPVLPLKDSMGALGGHLPLLLPPCLKGPLLDASRWQNVMIRTQFWGIEMYLWRWFSGFIVFLSIAFHYLYDHSQILTLIKKTRLSSAVSELHRN